jgi:predicted secreted protein
MSITGAIVLYAVTWFMVFFITLQVRVTAQSDTDHVVPGTPPGAPAHEIVGRKARIATIIATPLWAVICGVILSGWITIADLDWFGRG